MALVLTRVEGEALVLAVDGHRIHVEVASVDRGQVRLAVTADETVAIWRAELVEPEP